MAMSALATGSAMARYLSWPSESDRPPIADFITVDGTRLHYLDAGDGVPVVFLHGNGSMIGDFVSSGIIERAASSRRVIAFDRPGFGYSERPNDRAWTPSAQASLLLRAFALLGIERPIIVGHSWGALVALALALKSPENVAGLVLLSGYYYPTPRSDAMAMAQVAAMLSVPVVARMMAMSAVRRVFAPCTVPERFNRAYSIPLALRPSQLKAVADEAAMLLEAAAALSQRYTQLCVPVRLIAGADDRIVETDKHSARLHRQLSGSTFHRVPETGHMVHHAAPAEVVAAIAAVGEARQSATRLPAKQGKATRRHWLHIGDGEPGRILAAT
jgi:pimeloyl-ACP methyl ester carboxylesterase